MIKKILSLLLLTCCVNGFSQGTNYAKISQLSAVSLSTNDFFVGLHWTGTNYSAMRFRWNDVKLYADTNMSVLTPWAWASNAVAPLASTNYVQTSSNGAVAQAFQLASNLTTSAIAPLVSTNALETRLATMASTNYVTWAVTNSTPLRGVFSYAPTNAVFYRITFPTPFPAYNSYAVLLSHSDEGALVCREYDRATDHVDILVRGGTPGHGVFVSWQVAQTNSTAVIDTNPN
jgi:hypothetical protein